MAILKRPRFFSFYVYHIFIYLVIINSLWKKIRWDFYELIFQADFLVKETSLDFSKIKKAALELFNRCVFNCLMSTLVFR